MKKLFLLFAAALLAATCPAGGGAQFKIGGKKIDAGKLLNAGIWKRGQEKRRPFDDQSACNDGDNSQNPAPLSREAPSTWMDFAQNNPVAATMWQETTLWRAPVKRSSPEGMRQRKDGSQPIEKSRKVFHLTRR